MRIGDKAAVRGSTPGGRWLRTAGIWALFCGTAIVGWGEAEEAGRPNILLIYVDDVGFSDIGAYCNTFIETPNLDKLAEQGLRFTSAYAPSTLCSPSRAALLTGRSPARLNFEFVTKYERDEHDWDSPAWARHWAGRKLLPPPFTLDLPLEEITLAEALKEAGYVSGISGKWHVAAHHQRYKGWSLTHGPRQQGFDWAADTFGSHPYGYRDKGLRAGSLGDYGEGEYPRDELTERAIDFLGMDHDKPFFLFVSHYFMHTPVDTRCEWLMDKYRSKAGGEMSQRRIVYAAMLETLDHYIGQLLDSLERKGLAENTVVIFASDQGGDPRYAFNRPYRGSKWNLYEGGIRVPQIVRWPGVVDPGSVTDAPVIQMDFMPTFRAIASLKQDIDRELDGVSLLPLLKGGDPTPFEQRDLYWHFPYYQPEGQMFDEVRAEIGVEDEYISRTTPHSALRQGDYKLLYFYEDERAELYNLAVDPAEETDLSASQSSRAAAMERDLFERLNGVGARFPRKVDGGSGFRE